MNIYDNSPEDFYDMDEIDCIINDIQTKYGEWLEMAGDDSPALRERIIVQILLREISEKSFYERELRKIMHRTRHERMATVAENQNNCHRCRNHFKYESMEN